MKRLTHRRMVQLKRWNTRTLILADKHGFLVVPEEDEAGRAFSEAATKKLGQKGGS